MQPHGADLARIKIMVMNLISQSKVFAKDIWGAFCIGGNVTSIARLVCDFTMSKFIRLLGIKPIPKERGICLRNGVQLTYRLDRADIYTIHEIWIARDYILPSDFVATNFVDIGANIGFATVSLAKRHLASRVVAIEPSSANVCLLRKNLAANHINAEVIEGAAGPEDGSGVFDAGPSATNGRIVFDTPAALSSVTERSIVRMISMKSVLELFPGGVLIDLVKIDIEGGEQALLSGDISWISRIRAILIEFHPTLVNYPALQRILLDAGFTRKRSICTNELGGNTVEHFVREP